MNKKEEYNMFMYNQDNEYNCSKCPENIGSDDWQGKLPCGQQNCWVCIHCNNGKE